MKKHQVKFDDHKFIEQTMNWPRWPFLTMKKGRECGIIIDCPHETPSTVYLINYFSVKEEVFDKGKTLMDVEKVKYHSIQEMLSDGWKVD